MPSDPRLPSRPFAAARDLLRCEVCWPLEDPSPQDAADGITHRCRFDFDHGGTEHVCPCGERHVV